MTITNGYTNTADLAEEVGIAATDVTLYTTKLERAIASASRQIDGHCGRRFWQDATVQTRQYKAHHTHCLEVDDISTTVGLVVATDDAANGTFTTAQTINTSFLLEPFNAADMVPVWPYTMIRFVDGFYCPINSYGRPGLQVIAKFGWPAIPDAVTKACLIQATQLFKASDAVFGGVQLSPEMGGVLRVRGQLNPMAAGLVEEFVKLQ